MFSQNNNDTGEITLDQSKSLQPQKILDITHRQYRPSQLTVLPPLSQSNESDVHAIKIAVTANVRQTPDLARLVTASGQSGVQSKLDV